MLKKSVQRGNSTGGKIMFAFHVLTTEGVLCYFYVKKGMLRGIYE